MSNIPDSRLPLPVEVKRLDFLSSLSAPTHVVLHFRQHRILSAYF